MKHWIMAWVPDLSRPNAIAWLVALAALHCLPAYAVSVKQVRALRATFRPKVDGFIEEGWAHADTVSDFIQQVPDNNAAPTVPTTAYVLFDNTSIYVAFRCRAENVAASLVGPADEVVLCLSPIGDLTTGYEFTVSAAGRESAFALEDDGRTTSAWSGVWFSAVRRSRDGYTVELSIPFWSLHYRPGDTTWGVDFGRFSAAREESSFWCYHKTTGLRVSDFGTLVGIHPPVARWRGTVVPSGFLGTTRDYETSTDSRYAAMSMEIGVLPQTNGEIAITTGTWNILQTQSGSASSGQNAAMGGLGGAQLSYAFFERRSMFSTALTAIGYAGDTSSTKHLAANIHATALCLRNSDISGDYGIEVESSSTSHEATLGSTFRLNDFRVELATNGRYAASVIDAGVHGALEHHSPGLYSRASYDRSIEGMNLSGVDTTSAQNETLRLAVGPEFKGHGYVHLTGTAGRDLNQGWDRADASADLDALVRLSERLTGQAELGVSRYRCVWSETLMGSERRIEISLRGLRSSWGVYLTDLRQGEYGTLGYGYTVEAYAGRWEVWSASGWTNYTPSDFRWQSNYYGAGVRCGLTRSMTTGISAGMRKFTGWGLFFPEDYYDYQLGLDYGWKFRPGSQLAAGLAWVHNTIWDQQHTLSVAGSIGVMLTF